LPFFGTTAKNGAQTMKVASRAHLLSNRVNQMLQVSGDLRKGKHSEEANKGRKVIFTSTV